MSQLFEGIQLPPSISEGQIREKFKEMSKGSTTAREELIVHNIRLVIHEALKFSNTDFLLEDLVSIGCIGLIKSIDCYDMNKNNKFSTFSARCIDNEILMFLRSKKKLRNEVSLHDAISVNFEGVPFTFLDFLVACDHIDSDCEKIEEKEAIQQAISTLTERESQIVSKYFGFGDEEPMNQKELSQMYHLSQSLISKIIKTSVHKIGTQLVENHVIEPSKVLKKRNTQNE